MSAPSPKQSIASSTFSNDDISLKQVFDLLLRQKFLIINVTITALIVSFFMHLPENKWEGQFQIVLENKNAGTSSLAQLAVRDSLPTFLAGMGGGSNVN